MSDTTTPSAIPIALAQARAVIADLEEALAVLDPHHRPALWAPRTVLDLIPSTQGYLGRALKKRVAPEDLRTRLATYLTERAAYIAAARRGRKWGDPVADLATCVAAQARIAEEFPHLAADLAHFSGQDGLPGALEAFQTLAAHAPAWGRQPKGNPDAVTWVCEGMAQVSAGHSEILAQNLRAWLEPRRAAAERLTALRQEEPLLRGRSVWTIERAEDMPRRVHLAAVNLTPLWGEALKEWGAPIPSRPPGGWWTPEPPPPPAPPAPRGWRERLRAWVKSLRAGAL